MSQAADRADAETAERPGAPTAHPEFDRLVRTMWRLRQPDGCPWDREQTHRSITRNMIEEAYEAVDAIESDDIAHLLEELGEEVMDIWDDVKAAERAAAAEGDEPEPGLLDSIPRGLPSLMQCQKLSKRAAKAGFEWADEGGVWDKVAEERAEFEREAPGTPERAEEFGDLLFTLVQVARWEGIDAEEALAAANRKFRARWGYMEAEARERGIRLNGLSDEAWDELWRRAKAEEKAARAE